MEFKEGAALVPSEAAPGIVGLEEFSSLASKMKRDDLLLSYGLTPEELRIFDDFQKGKAHLEAVHKNCEKTALNKLIDEIQNKVSRAEEAPRPTRREDERPTHPMDTLEQLKSDMFSHLEDKEPRSHNKRRKFIRRMHRKAERESPLPEPKILIRKSSTNNEHKYNNFIKLHINTSNVSSTSKKPSSKWDIKETEEILITKPTVIHKRESKIIGCSDRKLYTIRDGKIIQLKGKTDRSNSDDKIIKYVEGTKLNISEIKQSKFKDYDPGTPSKVLFIKNISNSVVESDLNKLFAKDEEFSSIKLMTGRMKGQAFATFNSEKDASLALEEFNGLVLKGKPIIIQFGKNGT